MANERHITGLEEIIRQAYFIGLKDKANLMPTDQPYFLKNRVKQIVADIEWQLKNGPLESFDYEKLTK